MGDQHAPPHSPAAPAAGPVPPSAAPHPLAGHRPQAAKAAHPTVTVRAIGGPVPCAGRVFRQEPVTFEADPATVQDLLHSPSS